jgi:hypothetical protein
MVEVEVETEEVTQRMEECIMREKDVHHIS